MNKSLKVLLLIIITTVMLTGITYASVKIYQKIKGQVSMTPIYTSKISTIDNNKIWCGTFNLVWNDFINDVVGKEIIFEDGDSELANELNKQIFTAKELSENSYFKIHGNANIDLKNKIESGIKQKFNEDSEILDKIDWGNTDAYVLYAILKKEFNYLEKFQVLENGKFGDSEEKVQYFGLEPDKNQESRKNVEVLFYNSKNDFAIKLKTKEKEEVFLYKTTGENKSFEENYQEMLEKKIKYDGEKEWQKNDTLKIPFIKIKDVINYDELCGRYIKDSNSYIEQALQTIEFELNNVGGSVKSEAVIQVLQNIVLENGKEFIFDDDFILYLKEESGEKPYLALKVDNIDILEINNK